MVGSRTGAVDRAATSFEDGTYVRRLTDMIAVPSESQKAEQHGHLHRYLSDIVAPMLSEMGFKFEVHNNPRTSAGPILLATRMEAEDKPTVLIYGHGDVVNGQPHIWREGLDPWVVRVEEDRLYGRGTADNKGQHLVAIEALRAVLAERGTLGFNAKFLVETGEEVGSPGIKEFLAENRHACSADVFIGLDGPRQSTHIPEMRLGARGGIAFDLDVKLREGNFHSGHWGGVLPDAGFVLANALASIVSPSGEILVDGWKPGTIPKAVRSVCNSIRFEAILNLPAIDPNWGEPGLSKAEKIFAWTSVTVLAFKAGQPEAPVNAVQGHAWARLQVRYDVSIDGEQIVPALRRHLDDQGLGAVEIVLVKERDMFPPSRTDPAHPWVQALGRSMEKTTGERPNIVPNSSGGNPSEFFRAGLDVPVIWVPNSYAASGQHAADEHLLIPVVKQGLAVMAGIFWDIGEEGFSPSSRT